MSDKELSTEVAFVRGDLPETTSKQFGDFAEQGHNLSLDPETTGTKMLAENFASLKVATKRDMHILTGSPPPQTSNSDSAPLLLRKAMPQAIASYGIRGGQDTQTEELVVGPPVQVDNRVNSLVDRQDELIIGMPDFLPGWFLDVGVARKRAVCKVETSGTDYKGREGAWSGTGFLISDSLLITNHHVLNSRKVCQNATCIFDYELEESGKVRTSKSFSLNPDQLFLTSPANELDFTVCWIEGQPSHEYGCVPIYRHAFTVKTNDCANIVQHPMGQYKAVVVQKNEIKGQDSAVIHYASDTQPGSSGAPVFNNAWRLSALHHASKRVQKAIVDVADPQPPVYLNEGIKFSAIAAYLESLTQAGPDGSAAARILALFQGTDAAMGYFGNLGRISADHAGDALERVVDSYRGEADDIDIGFWNIEWFNKHYRDKIHDVAQIVLQMNLDAWVFEESSPEATQALIEYLNQSYKTEYAWLASEPQAPSAKQTTTVLWNTKTVTCAAIDWPTDIRPWFDLTSNEYTTPDDLPLGEEVTPEGRDGKIFDRFPGLFQLRTVNRQVEAGEEFNGYLVPLHLKALPKGSKRREFASHILAAAVHHMRQYPTYDTDWILGGDLNATLASRDLDRLSKGELKPISAEDECGGAFSYIKKPHQSLIDHIFLSPNLMPLTGKDGFFIVAKDKTWPDYLMVSDHRPVLVRLSLQKQPPSEEKKERSASTGMPQNLRDILQRLSPSADTVNLGEPTPATGQLVAGLPGLHEALQVLRESATRTYYDQTADETQRKQYYSELPKGLSRTALFDHFSRLLTRTHTTPLPYNPAQHLYPWVDLRPGGQKIKSIYSAAEFDPKTFILADLRADAARAERIETLRLERSINFESTSDPEVQYLLEDLEAEFAHNCEHVVPQSWFNKAHPMRGDLHHLFACEPTCNSFRSNTPYYEFAEWDERVMQQCGRSETLGFEPKDGKGTVARATLYFLLRYPRKITNSANHYTPERIDMLLGWHLAEPPSLYERHRNAAIHTAQGNRNPLVDFPRLSGGLIDFTRGLG
jgi:endonuclease I/V8-like Glu-specific endopeptidase